jgi:hypothetical protein
LASNNHHQSLQGAPVVEAFLFGFEQRFARVAVFVEVFGEADGLLLSNHPHNIFAKSGKPGRL